MNVFIIFVYDYYKYYIVFNMDVWENIFQLKNVWENLVEENNRVELKYQYKICE